jgi:AraC-like DNA-binding protein
MTLRHRIGGYREYGPSAETAFFCEAFWTHHTPHGDAIQGAAHRVLPDPAVSVAFQAHRDDSGRPVRGAIVLIGAKTRPRLFPLVPGLELAAVRLKLEWVAPILGIDPAAIDDRIVDLSAVRPAMIDRLEDRLWRASSAIEVLPILARTILETRISRLAPPPAATAALEIVRRSSGRLPCQRVAAALGVSMRHLRRQVHDSAGLSPKTYARVLRLAYSMQLADRHPRPHWADVAVQSGYCDQSHLIRECLALGGGSPQQLHAERCRQLIDLTAAAAVPTHRLSRELLVAANVAERSNRA